MRLRYFKFFFIAYNWTARVFSSVSYFACLGSALLQWAVWPLMSKSHSEQNLQPGPISDKTRVKKVNPCTLSFQQVCVSWQQQPAEFTWLELSKYTVANAYSCTVSHLANKAFGLVIAKSLKHAARAARHKSPHPCTVLTNKQTQSHRVVLS